MRLLLCSLDAYSLLNRSTNYPFGGAEVRAVHFAKGLARLGSFEITILTRNQGRGQELIDGIRIVPFPELFGKGYWEWRTRTTQRILAKLRLLRSSPFRSLQAVIDEVAPDLVMILGMSQETVRLFHETRKRQLKFVFGVASDLDLTYSERNHPAAQDYLSVIQSADLVLAQTPEQMEVLRRKMGVQALLLMNPVAPKIEPTHTIAQRDVLWVGKSSSIKQPLVFLSLAAALPQFTFRMIMNKADEQLFATCMQQVPANLEIVEHVPYDDIHNYFAASRLFVSTSTHEGFPNTFLQAANYGLPIVSLKVDPNNMLSLHGCGINADGKEEAVSAAIFDLIHNAVRSDTIRGKQREYLRTFHDSAKLIQHLNEVLLKLIKS